MGPPAEDPTRRGDYRMKEYLQLLKKSPLFYGIREEELYTLIKCCGGEEAEFEPGEPLFRMGESLYRVVILLSGRVLVEQEDFWGKKRVLKTLKEGETFGAVYACSRTALLPVSLVAEEKSRALFLNYQRMITFCTLACSFHTRLIHNLLRLISEESVSQESRLEHISAGTTREKLLSYLSTAAIEQGGREFDLTVSRQELAEYLAVDRSAMSGELGKMKKEGILDFKKNHFELK